MSETERATRSRPLTVQIGLRAAIVLVGLAAIVLAWQSQRQVVTPGNVAKLSRVGTLHKDIYEVAWSPERDRVALLGWEEPVEIRDAISFRPLETIGAGRKLIHFAFSPSPDVVAFCGNNQMAEILDRTTGRSIALATGNSQPGMMFSPDGRLLATGGYGTTVRLWRVDDGALVHEFPAHGVEGGLTPVFSPDGAILAVGNRNAKTRLFDVATGRLLHVLHRASTQGLQFSPDGRTLAVAYVDGSLGLWDVATGKRLHHRTTTAEELYRVEWSPDGQILATAGLKGKLTLWNPSDLSILRELDGPEWVIGLRFSPDGRNLISAGGPVLKTDGPRKLQVWGIEGMLYSLANRPK